VIRGIYTAASAMLAATYRQKIVSNNLANIGTNGYRAEMTANLAFGNLLVTRMSAESASRGQPNNGTSVGRVGTGTMVGVSEANLTQGPLQQTGAPLDLAIGGDGFFVVETPDGPVLTRDGHFGPDAQGRLVTQQGYFVLGQNGRVQLDNTPVGVAADGTITQGNRIVDRLRIESYAAADLLRVGQTSFRAAAGAPPVVATGLVAQGVLEGANVDAVYTMTEMLKVAGAFSASQKVFQAVDGTLSRIVNDVARF